MRPAQLPEYVRGLKAIMRPLGPEASYYGHAASGLLHVRPVLDPSRSRRFEEFRQVADQTSTLVKQFKGSLSAEHGVSVSHAPNTCGNNWGIDCLARCARSNAFSIRATA